MIAYVMNSLLQWNLCSHLHDTPILYFVTEKHQNFYNFYLFPRCHHPPEAWWQAEVCRAQLVASQSRFQCSVGTEDGRVRQALLPRSCIPGGSCASGESPAGKQHFVWKQNIPVTKTLSYSSIQTEVKTINPNIKRILTTITFIFIYNIWAIPIFNYDNLQSILVLSVVR